MAADSLKRVIQDVRAMLAGQNAAELPDADLVRLFARHRDETAFRILVHRHGPMVMGVCRRVLRNSPDAEDAFQATFLILVKKAAVLRAPAKLGNWLYGVAFRAASQARQADQRRRQKEAAAPVRIEPHEGPWDELLPVFDQELARLPEKYRMAVLYSDLEGRSRRQVARLLGCPEGTVASRLVRGRAMLAKRLNRHLPESMKEDQSDAPWKQTNSASVTSVLVTTTARAGIQYAEGKLHDCLIPAKVLALTQGVIHAMLLNKAAKLTVILLLLLSVTSGAGLTIARAFAPSPDVDEPTRESARAPSDSATNLQGVAILSKYQRNELAADQEFSGKRIRVEFPLYDARIKRFQWQPNVEEWGPQEINPPVFVMVATFPPVRVSRHPLVLDLVFGFGNDAEKDLTSLTKDGQQVVIEGRCLGRTIQRSGREIVRFADCKVIESKDLPGAPGRGIN